MPFAMLLDTASPETGSKPAARSDRAEPSRKSADRPDEPQPDNAAPGKDPAAQGASEHKTDAKTDSKTETADKSEADPETAPAQTDAAAQSEKPEPDAALAMAIAEIAVQTAPAVQPAAVATVAPVTPVVPVAAPAMPAVDGEAVAAIPAAETAAIGTTPQTGLPETAAPEIAARPQQPQTEKAQTEKATAEKAAALQAEGESGTAESKKALALNHAAEQEQQVRPEAPARPSADFDKPVQDNAAQPEAAQTKNADTSSQPLTPQTAKTHATQNAAGIQAAAPNQQAAAVPVAGLAVEIAAQARAGKHRFEIRLDPPELGRIDVRLEVDREGHVTSRLVVDRVETLDMLRRDAQQIERALNQAGLKTSDNSLQFSLRDQGQNQHHAQDENGRDTARGIIPDEDFAASETVRGYGRLTGHGGGLDIRV